MSTTFDDPRPTGGLPVAHPVQPGNDVTVDRRTQRWVTGALLLAVAAGLVVFARFLAAGYAAVTFAWELDYGEGIVWEQMRLMVAGRGYGAIDGFPAIVFHYPPLYHLLTAGLSAANGLDPLAVGRSLSLGATVMVGLFAGLIAARTVRADDDMRIAAVCGLVASLSVFGFSPIYHWAPLMRVDMLSLALGFAGVFVAMAALTRPRLIALSALLFVAAVFTKQTSIVAPAAVFLTLLLLRPRLAWLLAACCVAMGLVVLAALMLATDNGFVRHVFLYNVNRLEVHRLAPILTAFIVYSFAFIAIAVGVATRVRARWPDYRSAGSVAVLRERLLAAPGDAFFLLILVYASLAFAMSFTIAKSGSNLNYLNEWMAVLAVLLGIAMRDAAAAAFGTKSARSKSILSHPIILPLLVGIQSMMFAPVVDYSERRSAARVAELRVLEGMVRSARRPVISDDMVLLRRAGVAVSWEPSIFAELASTNIWDERPFVALVAAGHFEFFVTDGVRGDVLFDSRYNPAVAAAMDAAYPVKREVAGYTLHLRDAAVR